MLSSVILHSLETKQTDTGQTGAQEKLCQVQFQGHHNDKIQGMEVHPLVTESAESASGYTKYKPPSPPRSHDRV